MATPNHKKPAFSDTVRNLKKQAAIVEDPDDWREQMPNWAFAKCDLRGCQWSWERIDGENLVQVLERLKDHESRRWKEILLDKSNGSIEISNERIAAEAKTRFVDLGFHDFDTIWKLRVNGPGRVWGIRIGRTLHIVWWDPDHGVYPMNIANN